MKISIFSIPQLATGKANIKDSRLDQVHKITKSKKETYIQVELISQDNLLEADAIISAASAKTDLILKDLEFVETRISRAESDLEKALLNKLKGSLEKEEFISRVALSEEEKQGLLKYSLFTNKPIVLAEEKDLEDTNSLLARALVESGYISFFTTGEKETRAWLIIKGTIAHEAAGAIHSDIQKGFIRAEIISFNDFITCGGESPAKQAGKMRLEAKEYVMQDADLTNFRFNK